MAQEEPHLPGPAAEGPLQRRQGPPPLGQKQSNTQSQSSQQQRVIGDYIVTQQIGSGSFAVVWKGRHKLTMVEVAIKEIATGKLNRKLQESLESEIAILKRANHPNIIRLFEIIKAPDRIFLILEYCAGGDLSDFIRRQPGGRVPEGAARYFMRQLGAGLQVLRANNLVHRDLKPQNLLLYTRDRHAVLKIADFGFARSLQPQGMAETLCGSPLYMAPEILQFQKYDAKADLWSVGAILFELVTGMPPFGGANHVQLLRNIERTEARIAEDIAATLTQPCISMIRQLLKRNPVERLSFEEFFHHPFLDLPRRRASKEDDLELTTAIPEGTPPAVTPNEHTSSNSTSLDDGLPFVLDEDHPGPSENNPPFITRAARPVISGGDRGKSPWGVPAQKGPSARGAEKREADKGGPSRPAVASSDSMECIERDYVVVGRSGTISPVPSQANLTSQAPPLPAAPRRATPSSSHTSSAREGGSGLSARAENPRGGEEDSWIEEPPSHPPDRLASLQRCARLITELAIDKLEAQQRLEALALQLLCLALWREALSVCHAWAEAADEEERTAEDQAEGQVAAASACAVVEREFIMAVERAESVGLSVQGLDGAQLPDAVELVFQAALAVGRAGAVEELMGNVGNASVAYAKAAALFYFLLVEAPALPLAEPVVLTPQDRHRLRRYVDAVNARHRFCAEKRSLQLSQQR